MSRTLYSYYRSSAAFRVRIALALKGLDYDYAAVNIFPGVDEQKSDKYRSMNPQGRVPFLVDSELSLGQSPAILEYLEEAYPSPALLPESLEARARVRQLMNIIACDIHPLNNLAVLGELKSRFGADDAATQDWYRHWIRVGFTALEAIMAESPGTYTHGHTVTLADVCLVPQVWNARRFSLPLDDFPHIVAADAACRELPAFQAAMPERQPDAPKA
ncbi:maleylacetoacetate isomerase [Gimibacter soli]|uniref:Maleylacetoacetate isomerase n=1 Tax=Gimibacter soli TaxID=3024400 RepID=A0AAE9XLW1_9PROT|nr:maleylacetoacetate isomerase [Gimibacter soli]WCL52676.1 maleylacetoacetate isomerase [Gimibacter soli]